MERLLKFVEDPGQTLMPDKVSTKNTKIQLRKQAKKNGVQDCQEILEVVKRFIKQNNISLDEWTKIYNT